MVERRKFERYDLAVPVKIEPLARTAKKKKISLKTANVCAGGAYFHTDTALTEGTKVQIDLMLSYAGLGALPRPRNARIRILGTVTRSRQDGMAIRFSDDYVIAPIASRISNIG
ncbi:MAG: PilZ domain protein [Syntrophaceae bacterium PtaB.Bin038]|jgi:c-di-GMP-binding flagellar brake protein YcgR|nr:MAG: PilZ domain protein [Syntrophaceae bacterium PtaB.Bin038]